MGSFQSYLYLSSRDTCLEDRIGSIDVGKDADIVIWSKSPLELDANVEYTIIDGKIAYRK